MIDVIDYNTHKGDLPHTCAVINMPNDAYHDHSALSKSDLDLVNRSMAHYLYAPKRIATRQMEIGTAIHTALLEPDRYESEYVKLPNVTDRRASEYKQAVKVHGSELVLAGHEADKVDGMKNSASMNPEFYNAIKTDGFSEISFFAVCQHTGEQLKCRFDRLYINEGDFLYSAMDVKKTQDVRYEKFQRSVAAYRYQVQQAFYSYVYGLVTDNELECFKFFAIEEDSPHANKIYELDDEAAKVGNREFGSNLTEYMSYNADGTELPNGLIQDSEVMSLPSWALDEEAQAEYEV